jgi:membrane associated rhomboid family serine protease
MPIELRKPFKAACKSCPVTMVIIVAAVALHLAVLGMKLRAGDQPREVYRSLGAVRSLAIFVHGPNAKLTKQIDQLTGPFELWDGQWWRIPISGFHHGDLLHLLLNCAAIAVLGGILEPRLGRFSYLVFFLLATMASLVSEFLLENIVVGLSGGAYALFGVVLVLRTKDSALREQIPDSFIRFGIVWLFLCVLLTVTETMLIANTAHFVGFGYGWLFGQMLYGPIRFRRAAQIGFVTCTLAIWPGVYFAMSPFWIGRYHWYRAAMLHDGQPLKQRADLQNAVARDPSLGGAWADLAALEMRTGNPRQAWKTALQGLYYSRSSKEALARCRILWRHFRSDEQKQEARDTLHDVFGDRALVWQERFESPGDEIDTDAGPLAANPRDDSAAADDASIPFEGLKGLFNQSPANSRGALLPTEAGGKLRPPAAPPVDPDRPDSAAVGITI